MTNYIEYIDLTGEEAVTVIELVETRYNEYIDLTGEIPITIIEIDSGDSKKKIDNTYNEENDNNISVSNYDSTDIEWRTKEFNKKHSTEIEAKNSNKNAEYYVSIVYSSPKTMEIMEYFEKKDNVTTPEMSDTYSYCSSVNDTTSVYDYGSSTGDEMNSYNHILPMDFSTDERNFIDEFISKQ